MERSHIEKRRLMGKVEIGKDHYLSSKGKRKKKEKKEEEQSLRGSIFLRYLFIWRYRKRMIQIDVDE
jgi:hypothetical protein